MRSAIQSSGFKIEQLEQRRLLCADLVGAAGGHTSDVIDASHVIDAPSAHGATNHARAHVVAAFAQSNGGMRGGELVWGETTVVNGATVATWAIISKKTGVVMAAGATVPVSLAETMPARGSGPAGAFASLEFPAVVQETTYFNHLEIHSQPNGHPAPPGSVNPDRNRVPHFDYHFYGIPEADVFNIPGATPPLPPVAPDRLPVGYIQPGPSEPQMGRHSAPQWSLADPGPLSTIVLAGYLPDASQMHFIEPMISREVLLERQDFSLNVPMPQTFDRDTRYPTTFEVVFKGGAHHFIFRDFITTNSGSAQTTSGAAPVNSRPHLQPAAPAGSLFSMSIADTDSSDDDLNPDDETSVAELLS
jgi:hypothetical protein